MLVVKVGMASVDGSSGARVYGGGACSGGADRGVLW